MNPGLRLFHLAMPICVAAVGFSESRRPASSLSRLPPPSRRQSPRRHGHGPGTLPRSRGSHAHDGFPIEMEPWLPAADWNGNSRRWKWRRAGSINAAGMADALREGYATASPIPDTRPPPRRARRSHWTIRKSLSISAIAQCMK